MKPGLFGDLLFCTHPFVGEFPALIFMHPLSKKWRALQMSLLCYDELPGAESAELFSLSWRCLFFSARTRGSTPSSCGSSPLNISTPPPDCSPGGKRVSLREPHDKEHWDGWKMTLMDFLICNWLALVLESSIVCCLLRPVVESWSM